VTNWTPPLSIAELAHTASHLACGAKHIEATWGEIDAALPRREPTRLDNLRIPAVNAGQVVPGTDYQESVTEHSTTCGTIGSARQAGGHARHAGTVHAAVAPLVHSDSGARPAGAAMRIPPFAARQEGRPVGQWPLQSFLELGALAGAVPCARLHTRHLLWEWGLAGLAESTELLVSEMITNGVQASRAMTQAAVRLWLVSDRARVVILAWDASPLPPVPADPRADAENGRGLLLIDAISERWGWYFPGEQASTDAPGQHGKVVWAVVQLTTRTDARQGRQQWRH
jgi:hypothetical protein